MPRKKEHKKQASKPPSTSLNASSTQPCADVHVESPSNLYFQEQYNLQADLALRRIEDHIKKYLPRAWQRLLSVLLVNHYIKLSGVDELCACILVADQLKFEKVSQMTKWLSEFRADPEKFTSSLPVSSGDEQELRQKRGLPTKMTSTGPRPWLLEEHPELLEKAQQWVQQKTYEGKKTRNSRLFKITDFQQFVNQELLVPLYNVQESAGMKGVTPISHSTARSWLSRLGYYETLKDFQLNGGCVKDDFSNEEQFVAFKSTEKPRNRKRAATWSGSQFLSASSSSGDNAASCNSDVHCQEYMYQPSLFMSDIVMPNVNGAQYVAEPTEAEIQAQEILIEACGVDWFSQNNSQ